MVKPLPKTENSFMHMKHSWKQLLLMPMAVLLTACSATDTPADVPDTADGWEVNVSRTVTGGEDVTVALRFGTTTRYGTLRPSATEGAKAAWVSEIPTWPDASTPVQVVAISPAVSTLPATVDATDGIAWLVDAVSCNAGSKPDKFMLTHLMAMVEVHIKLHDDTKHHYEPTDATIGLHTTATIDYARKQLTDASGYQSAFSLGSFSKESGSTDTDENWVNTPQIVVPQTFKAGEPCLRFVVHGHTYIFVPSTDIVLPAGQKTKLMLGAAYDEMEGESVTLMNISIADWTTGGTTLGGEAEKQ